MPSLWSLPAVFAEALCAKLQHSFRNLPATFRLPYTAYTRPANFTRLGVRVVPHLLT